MQTGWRALRSKLADDPAVAVAALPLMFQAEFTPWRETPTLILEPAATDVVVLT
jgi:hypothetical protein